MTTYVGTAADELLGAGEYFQLTLTPDVQWFNPADWGSMESQFMRGVTDVWEKLPASGLAFPIGHNPAGPGLRAATLDVRTSDAARNATVGELAAKAGRISGDVTVSAIKRIPVNARNSTARAADRKVTQARASNDEMKKHAGPLGDIWAAIAGLLLNARNIVLLALVAAIVVGGAYILKRSGK